MTLVVLSVPLMSSAAAGATRTRAVNPRVARRTFDMTPSHERSDTSTVAGVPPAPALASCLALQWQKTPFAAFGSACQSASGEGRAVAASKPITHTLGVES